MGFLTKLFQREPPNVPELLARQATGRLIDLLHHEDRTVRLQAAEALGKLRAASSVGALGTLVSGTDAGLRDAAATALAAIGPAAIAVLAAIVTPKYGAYEPKVAAARCLGEIGDPAAVAPLLVAMNDMTANVRAAAADALAKLGTPAVPGLISLLQDQGNGQRDEVAKPLARIGDARAIAPLLQALTHSPESEWRVRVKAIEALESFHGVPSAPFFGLLLDTSDTIRNAAAKRLAQADPHWSGNPAIESVAATALQLVHSPDKERRSTALGLLGRLERREFTSLFVQALADPEVILREQACATLGRWREPAAIEPLLDRLRDENGWVCLAAGKALAAIDPAWRTTDAGRRARDQLLQHVGDAKPDARTAALRGLAEFSDPGTVDAVAASLADRNCYVRDQAVHTLKAIGGADAVRHIITALSDSDSLVRSTAARCLGELVAPEAVEPLQSALARDTSPAATQMREALDKLRDAGFQAKAVETSEERSGLPSFDAGVTILKFPPGHERQWERHCQLIAELKQGGLLRDLAVHQATPKSELPALIILTGPRDAIGALGKVYFHPLAEEFVRRVCGGDWEAINAASSLCNVSDPGATADLRAVNEFIQKIDLGNYTLDALPDRISSRERRQEQEGSRRTVGSKTGGPVASTNPVCPDCRTIYNRREVIRQLKQASPFLFDSAIWTTKFRCVKCGAVLVISGSASE